MAPMKKTVQPNLKNKGSFIDIPSTDSQSIDFSMQESTKPRVRMGNWTEVMDFAMLNVMTEEYTLGSFVNGSFTPLAWIRIVRDFNERTKLGFTKVHLQNRFKVLKKQYLLYQTLANKSGWGWDYTLNIPTAGDPTDWEAIIAENPAYAKCRDKPFPAYQSIEMLTGKSIATGRHGFTSRVEVEDVRSTSSSSPASQPLNLENLAKNLEEVNDANSTSPTTTPMKVRSHYEGTASGRTSSSKRPRVSSPNPTPPSNRRRKDDGRTEALYELVELGKKRTDIAQTLMDREIQARPKLHSIEECMERLTTVAHLSPEGLLAVCDALKDERNRPIFMKLSGDMLCMWIDRQIAMQQCYPAQRPMAPSFAGPAPFFTAASSSFSPGPFSPFPPANAAFPVGAPTFPPPGPSGPSNLSSFSPERPSFPPN